MNNSNKGRFNIAKRNAGKGQKQTKFGNKTFNFEYQPRKNREGHGKVANRGFKGDE